MPKLHVLADNTVASVTPGGLHAEWGFSALIDGVLLDAGQTGVARENAQALGLETAIETIVLSHGHWDHTGGLTAFLEAEPEIYLHPEALRPKYKEDRFIGLPYTRERLENDATIVEHRDPVEVADGIVALGEVPRPHDDNPTGTTLDETGSRIEDRLLDDQSLAVEFEDGIALILGCCHAGLRNTVEYAEEVTEQPVRAIVGGTHLTAMDEEGVADLAKWLSPKLRFIAPCHCTGPAAERVLAETLSSSFQSIGVGSVVEL